MILKGLNNIIIKQCAFIQMIYVPLNITFSTQVSSKVTYNILPAAPDPVKHSGENLSLEKSQNDFTRVKNVLMLS